MTVFSMHAAMAACVHYLAVNDQLPKPLAEAEGLNKMFFPLIDHKNFEMAFVLSLKSRNSPK